MTHSTATNHPMVHPPDQRCRKCQGLVGSGRLLLVLSRARAAMGFVEAFALALVNAAGISKAEVRVSCGMQDLESTKRPSKAAHYTGWEASSSALHAALNREQGVDGILGMWPHPSGSHCAHSLCIGLCIFTTPHVQCCWGCHV